MLRSVRENCHHIPSTRLARPSFSIAVRSFWQTTLIHGGGRAVVAYAREAEQISWKLGAAGVQDEGSAHSQDSAEKAGFENDIVSRRRLARHRRRLCSRAVRRPVVLSEHERRKVNFARQLEKTFQCAGPGIEGCRPGFHPRDVFEAARQCLHQLRLLC